MNVDGGSTYALGADAELDATPFDGQSDFAQEFAINSSQTVIDGMIYGTGTISLGALTLTDGFVSFFYDIQETGADKVTDISDIIIQVDGTEVWSYDADTFLFNTDGAIATDSPLGNGADAELRVSFDVFKGFGFTGASEVTFLWKQENDDNGPDEWVNIGLFSNQIGDGPIDGPQPPAVPLPASLPLMLLGAGAFAALRKRRA